MDFKKLAIIMIYLYINKLSCMSTTYKKPLKLPSILRLAFGEKNQTESKLKEMIEIFLKNQVDHIEAIDGKGKTMLTLVCQLGYVEIIKFLHSKGANMEIKDDKDLTPLDWSILSEKEQSIETLINLGVNLTNTNRLNLAINHGKPKALIPLIKGLIKIDPKFLITKKICDMAKKAAEENKFERKIKEYQELIGFLEYQMQIELIIRMIHRRKTTLSKIPEDLLSTIIRFAYGPKQLLC